MDPIQFNVIPKDKEEWKYVLREIDKDMNIFINSDKIKDVVDKLKVQLSTTRINKLEIITCLDSDRVSAISGNLNTNHGWIYVQFESPKMGLTHIYGHRLKHFVHDLDFMDFFRSAAITRSQFNDLCNMIDVNLFLTIEKYLINYNSPCKLKTKPWSTIASWIDPEEYNKHTWLKNNQHFAFRCLEFYQIKFEFIELINSIINYASNNIRQIKNDVLEFQHQKMLNDMEEIIGRAIAQGMDESKIRDLIDLAIVKTIQES